MMVEKMTSRVLIAWVLGLLTLSCMARFLGDQLVVGLYSNYSFSILNILAGCQGQHPVDFYLGRIHETLFGPIGILTSGLAFLFFSLRFLQDVSWKRFAAWLFGFLVFAKCEILFFPPYGDSVSGPFVEAMWLSRHHFDYWGLSQQPLFIRGGPKVYLISMYPSFIAMLMKLIPHAKTFLAVNHLIIFAMSAVIFAIFRDIARGLFNARIAIFLTFLLFALPLVQSQIEQLNMEIPVLFFLMLCFHAVGQKKILRAAVFSALAALVKVYAVYSGVAVFIVGIFLYINDAHSQKNIKILVSSIFALGCSVLGAYGLLCVLNPAGTVDKVGLFQGLDHLKRFPISYFYLISLFIFFWIVFRTKSDSSKKLWSTAVDFLVQNYVIGFMFLVSAGWFALFSTSAWIPPRYTLILLPSLVIGCFYVVDHLFPLLKKKEVIVFTLICFSFLSCFGLIYKPIVIEDHAVIERSLEYRNDVVLHMKIAKLVEEKYAHMTVAAPFTFAQALAFPEIGFVNKKLDVMIYLFPCLYENVKNFEGIETLDIRKVIWVGVNTPFMRAPYLPMGPNDFIVEKIYLGDKSACLFLGGLSVNAVYHQGQAFMNFLKNSGALDANKKIYN